MNQEMEQFCDPHPHEGPDRDNPAAPGLPVALTLLVIVAGAAVLIAKAFS